MFDRLGDLLSETLEEGEIPFVRINPKEENAGSSGSDSASKAASGSRAEKTENPRYEEEQKTDSSSRKNSSGQQGTSRKASAKKTVLKKVTPQLSFAYRLLGITFSATAEDIKKAYKEKLKIYHPDKYESNPVMKKVATGKTKQVIDSFNLIMQFISE